MFFSNFLLIIIIRSYCYIIYLLILLYYYLIYIYIKINICYIRSKLLYGQLRRTAIFKILLPYWFRLPIVNKNSLKMKNFRKMQKNAKFLNFFIFLKKNCVTF